MPLPESTKGCWPPEPFDIAQDAYDEIEAWWVGTPERLESVYRSNTLNQNTPRIHPSQYRGGVVGNIARRFWGDPPKLNQAGRKLHLPLGAEILQTSASLLFAEPVRITANESESAKIQKRLDKLFNTPRAHTAGLVAGEIQAAFGGVYGRIVVDPEIEDAAWLDFVDADRAVPEFRWGQLTAVTFWTELDDPDRNGFVYRHLERHEPGRIFHGLYRGADRELGQSWPLAEHPETARYADLVNAEGFLETGIDQLDVEYVPNFRPNPLWRGYPRLRDLGRPDLTPDVIGILESLDETYTSLVRDVRLGRARLVVSGVAVTDRGPGRGSEFDLDTEVFTELRGDPNNPMFHQAQFTIRVDEHIRMGDDLTEKAIRRAGYSPFSFGMGDDGSAMTATEVEAKARASYQTRRVKAALWADFFQKIAPRLAAIDRKWFPGDGVELEDEINVLWPPPVRDTDLMRAQTVQAWDTAKAVSLETKVAYLHQDWDDQQIEDEITRIQEESAASAPPDPFAIGAEGQQPPDGPPETPPGFDDENEPPEGALPPGSPSA